MTFQNVSSIVKTILFADDTSLFYSENNIHKLNHTINNELSKFDCWMRANKLPVNTKKTSYVVFKYQDKNESILICRCRLMTNY